MERDVQKAAPSTHALATILEALASPVRLEILRAFRLPRRTADVRIAADRSREGENPGRILARQTVQHHVDHLVAAGLLIPATGGRGRGKSFVIDHARLFALVDEVRNLARLRPLGPTAPNAGATMRHDSKRMDGLPPPPRLMLAFGRDEGVAFPLSNDRSKEWVIGRGAGASIRIDYDPYASNQHARIVQDADGFELMDLHSTNGTWVDWEPMAPGARVRLRDGAVIMAGRSILVLQT